MNIELQETERQIVAGLLQRIETTKTAAEASINAYGQSIGIIIQAIVRARGGDPKAQYTLDPTGSVLVQSEPAQNTDQQ